MTKLEIRAGLPTEHTLEGFEALFAQPDNQAIAADRTSRQVANNAEVDPSDSYKAGYADGMEEGAKLALWGDKPSEKFPEGWPAEIWLNAGDDELGPFSEYDEVSWCSAPQGESDIRYIREDLLATPPTTSGASTEQVVDRVRADVGPADFGVAPGNEEAARNYANFLLSQVSPASTVLTDERIIDLMEPELLKGDGGYLADIFPEYVIAAGRAIEREVAAQAGQVAVPGWISIAERLPEMHVTVALLDENRWMNTGSSDHNVNWHGAGYLCEFGQKYWSVFGETRSQCLDAVTHWMLIPAAPAYEESK